MPSPGWARPSLTRYLGRVCTLGESGSSVARRRSWGIFRQLGSEGVGEMRSSKRNVASFVALSCVVFQRHRVPAKLKHVPACVLGCGAARLCACPVLAARAGGRRRSRPGRSQSASWTARTSPKEHEISLRSAWHGAAAFASKGAPPRDAALRVLATRLRRDPSARAPAKQPARTVGLVATWRCGRRRCCRLSATASRSPSVWAGGPQTLGLTWWRCYPRAEAGCRATGPSSSFRPSVAHWAVPGRHRTL